MEKYLDKKPETSLSKSDVAAYIHDMKKLELKLFTLRKLHEQCVNERKQIDESSEKRLISAKRAVQDITDKLNMLERNQKNKSSEIIEKPKKELSEPFPLWKKLVAAFIICWIICWITVVIFFSLDESILYQIESILYQIPLIIILAPVILIMISIIILHIIAKYRYNKYYPKKQKYDQYIQQQEELSNYKKQYLTTKKDLEEAKKQGKKAQMQIEKLDHISQFLAQHIFEIDKQKYHLYYLNIVPLRYRTLNCMIEFDQMYRDDLVDTVREAIKLYEERVFRETVNRDINNIYNMLGNLASTMRNIESALYSVQNEVSRMSDEINEITFSNAEFQDKILSETRAARYATEALKESTKRCEWYLERQYFKN